MLTVFALCVMCVARTLSSPPFQGNERGGQPGNTLAPVNSWHSPIQGRTQVAEGPANAHQPAAPSPNTKSLLSPSDIDPSLEPSGGSKNVTRRQVAYQAYIPFIAFPPFFRLSDFVVLSTPRELVYPPCSPRPLQMTTMPTTTTTTTTPTTPTTDSFRGIDNRLGEGNDTQSTEPSRCVWAIVACCSPGSRNIRYSCFELLGCPGGFWDLSPCEDRVVMSAANSALNFYMQKASTTLAPPEDPGLDIQSA